MIRIRDRSAEESADFHRLNLPSPQFVKTGQRDRILLSRQLVDQAVNELRATGQKHISIIEPGCGRADISGPFSAECDVTGYEVSAPAAEGAKQDWPNITIDDRDAQTAKPEKCDILVITEFLEHIEDPTRFVERWMPLAKYCVLSSPVAGDRGKFKESGHLWSFDRDDIDGFFRKGQHEIVHGVEFRMAVYQMFLGLGRRIGLPKPKDRPREPLSVLSLRIARQAVIRCLRDSNPGPVHRLRHIAALGCGEFSGDIPGYFSMGHWVVGFERDANAGLEAQRKWPWMTVTVQEFRSGSQRYEVGIAPADVPEAELRALAARCNYLAVYGSGQTERAARNLAKEIGKQIFREQRSQGTISVWALGIRVEAQVGGFSDDTSS